MGGWVDTHIRAFKEGPKCAEVLIRVRPAHSRIHSLPSLHTPTYKAGGHDAEVAPKCIAAAGRPLGVQSSPMDELNGG